MKTPGPSNTKGLGTWEINNGEVSFAEGESRRQQRGKEAGVTLEGNPCKTREALRAARAADLADVLSSSPPLALPDRGGLPEELLEAANISSEASTSNMVPSNCPETTCSHCT